MPLTLRDHKILWARSGNRCAFPDCAQMLVDAFPGQQLNVVIGEEAHIIARVSNGPRGSASPDCVIESYDNHILLCPTHHSVVDKRPDFYTVSALRGMKRTHEELVRSQQHIAIMPSDLQVSQFAGLGIGVPIFAWQFLKALIVVYSFGSPPIRLPNGHYVGAGFEFREVDAARSTANLLTSSEGQPDIEFWIDPSAIHIIEMTIDPDRSDFVPFVEHVFDGRRSPVAHSISLLLTPIASLAINLQDITDRLQAIPAGHGNEAELWLYRLRNVGLQQPKAALAVLDELKKKPWYDGCTAECGTDIEHELKLVDSFQSRF